MSIPIFQFIHPLSHRVLFSKCIRVTFPAQSLAITCMHAACYIAQSCTTLVTLRTVVNQALLSMGFPRQKYQNGLSFPTPGNLPDPGMKPVSLLSPTLAGRFFTTCVTWEAPKPSHYG